MSYHILNGDCLATQLAKTSLAGERIICRECMIEGPLSVIIDERFWFRRADFIGLAYDETKEGYNDKVRDEFSKLISLPKDVEVNLWFEDDLFCQANMWLILHLLHQKGHRGNVYRVFPIMSEGKDHWQGFAPSNSQLLEQAFDNKVLMRAIDIALGSDLWQAYANHEMCELMELAHTSSNAFNCLPEVCQAHIDRFADPNRPEQAMREIIGEGFNSFKTAFAEFTKRQGIYGFGDLQVQGIYYEIVED